MFFSVALSTTSGNVVLITKGNKIFILQTRKETFQLCPCRTDYPKATPVMRLLFCLMAILMLLWDFMLLVTVLYYHMMIEKG